MSGQAEADGEPTAPGGAVGSAIATVGTDTTGNATTGKTATGRDRPDGKDAAAFRTIGEVTRALNIAPHVLRYWEEQFPMLRPVKRSGGRRYYRPEDIALLEDIHRLVHTQGYTLRGACQLLTSRGKRRPAPPPMPLLEGLIALRNDLAGLLGG